MTKEQIESVKKKAAADASAGLRPDLEADEVNMLIEAAERALLLEDVLSAAKDLSRDQATWDELFAAIDRAEAKP